MNPHLKRLALRLPKRTQYALRRTYYRVRGRPSQEDIALIKRLSDPRKIGLDVGANNGRYAVFLARWSKRVIAFEPNPILAAELEHALGSARIEVRNLGLGSAAGSLELYLPWVGDRAITGWASYAQNFDGVRWQGQAITRVETLRTTVTTLDALELDNIGLIKIDVEGFEDAVLAGGLETLRTTKPNLFIEIEARHRKTPISDVFDRLSAIGYSGFFVDGSTLRNIAEFDSKTLQKPENADGRGPYINDFVFLPEGRTL